jgi:DNA-binding PadR family transcriptional regulator
MEVPLSARAVLLQVLVLPGYGAELIERVRRATRGVMGLSTGSLYPALERLAAEGLARSRAGGAPRGAGRPRRYFELTLAGVAARDSQRRAVAALLRIGDDPLRGDSAELVGERLRRCARASASVLGLRRLVVDAEGEA